MPTISWPRISGYGGVSLPPKYLMSVPQTPHSSTRMSAPVSVVGGRERRRGSRRFGPTRTIAATSVATEVLTCSASSRDVALPASVGSDGRGAAVDEERLPGDERRVVGHEERDRPDEV